MNIFTIIIPIFNESECIFKLINEINEEFKNKLPEIIIVDDGSTDKFKSEWKKRGDKKIKVFSHRINLGKCKAMETGVKKSSNNLVCIMDGDGQNPPYEIKNLIHFWKKVSRKKDKFNLICGNRKNRQDTFVKKLSSKIANQIRRFILDDDCNDTACALKVFQKQDYLQLSYFKNIHRFLPALFKMNGGKIYNFPVDDRKRFGGESKFNFNNRFWVGIIDLLKIWILINKKRRFK